MTTVPEEAVKAMPERIYAVKQTEGSNCVVSFDTPSLDYNVEYVRADLALPHLSGVGVKVKPLDWKYVERVAMTYVTSDDRGMLYYINQSFGSDSYYFATVRYADGTMLYDGDDLPSAKAAAQDDYSYRILSALEPSAARALALEEVKLERSIERWRGMKPSEVMKGSTAQITYALEDARKDILSLARALSSPDHADAGKVEGDGWLPIESAPKGTAPHHWDAPSILVSDGQSVDQAEWEGDDGEPYWHATGGKRKSGNFLGYEPTHWRPLPSAPSGGDRHGE